jgi:hypothetical protein
MKNGLCEIEIIFNILKLYGFFSHDRNGITYAFFIADSKLGTIRERPDTIDSCIAGKFSNIT